MPVRDFQEALVTLANTLCNPTTLTPELSDALKYADELIRAQPTPLTVNTHRVLVMLAASIAVDMQDYVHDALMLITFGTSQAVWNALPESTREALDSCWPEEGGLTFVGKIGIAVVSEGFFYR